MGRLARWDDYSELLQLKDVAQLLGVNIDRVQRYAREGTIPARRLPGARQYYVVKAELWEWICSQPVADPERAERALKD